MVKHLCDTCGKDILINDVTLLLSPSIKLHYTGESYEFCSIICAITFLSDEMNKQKGEVK